MPNSLPQLERDFITDAGFETEMVFLKEIDLPCFSSSTLFQHQRGLDEMDGYFRSFFDLAKKKGVGCIIETPSWRASSDWVPQIGLTQEQMDDTNRQAVQVVRDAAADYPDIDILVSACIGPRGDGYDPGKVMTAEKAQSYHGHQIDVMAKAGADLVTAMTMTNIPEAIGIARAAEAADKPVVISFTCETDGKLPTGETLEEAITAVDEATEGYPAYYMINCAHPTHFASAIDPQAAWVNRIGGIRANASRCSHEELDNMEVLDDGDPHELGTQYRALRDLMPNLRVLGGCCGTDIRHVTAIADQCIG